MVVDPNAGLRASLVQILDQQQAQARVWGASVINAVAEAAVAYAPGRVVPKEAAPPLAPLADPRLRQIEDAVRQALQSIGVPPDEAALRARTEVQSAPENSRDATQALISAIETLVAPSKATPAPEEPPPPPPPEEPPKPDEPPLPDERDEHPPPDLPPQIPTPPVPARHPGRAVPEPSWVPTSGGLTMMRPPEEALTIHQQEVRELTEQFGGVVKAYLHELIDRNAHPNTLWWQGVVTARQPRIATVTLEPFPDDPTRVPASFETTRRVRLGQTLELVFVEHDPIKHYTYGVQLGPPVMMPPLPTLPNQRPTTPTGPGPRRGGRLPQPGQRRARQEPEPDYDPFPDPRSLGIPQGDSEPVPPWDADWGPEPAPTPPYHFRPPPRPVRPPPEPAPEPWPASPEPPIDDDDGLRADFEAHIARWGRYFKDDVLWYLWKQLTKDVRPLTRFWLGQVEAVNVPLRQVRVRLAPFTADGESVVQLCGWGIWRWSARDIGETVRVRVSTDQRWEVDDLA
jgi:hypothetical protein